MGLLSRSRRHEDSTPAAPVESALVRRYRYLLRTAPADALMALHAEALTRMEPVVRAMLLRTVGERLGADAAVSVDDVALLARLLTRAERRDPGCLLGGYDTLARDRLAGAVVACAAAAPHLEGYDGWDGAEPAAEPVVVTRPGQAASVRSSSSVPRMETSGS